ncbi:hypothetical protein EDC04DRAFT_2581837, partial [Pisolithus marmoratus]
RIKLQQLHKNEQDEGFTYIGPMGALPLTPVMILDWCHALVHVIVYIYFLLPLTGHRRMVKQCCAPCPTSSPSIWPTK